MILALKKFRYAVRGVEVHSFEIGQEIKIPEIALWAISEKLAEDLPDPEPEPEPDADPDPDAAPDPAPTPRKPRKRRKRKPRGKK